MSTSEELSTSRKRRSSSVIAGAKITALSVTSPDQVPSETQSRKKKSKDSSDKKKKSKRDEDSDEEAEQDECSSSDCSCHGDSESEDEVARSPPKKSKSDDKVSESFASIPKPSAPVTSSAPSSRSDVDELRRQVAQLRDMIVKRDNTINEYKRAIEAKDAQINTAATQLKTAVEACKEDTRAIACMVYRRDAVIADLADLAMDHMCEKARAQEHVEKMKKSMEKLFKDGIFRQCATGVCQEHAIFLLHRGDASHKEHYVCGDCAVGLMKASKNDEVICPQCRFKVKGLRLEVPEGTVKSLDDYLVKSDQIDALTFEEVSRDNNEYSHLRNEVYQQVRTADVTRIQDHLPNREMLQALQAAHSSAKDSDVARVVDEEKKFYSDHRRPRVSTPRPAQGRAETVIDITEDPDYAVPYGDD